VNFSSGSGICHGAFVNVLYHLCMQLTGKQVVNAPPSKVWDMLMDTDTLARIVPGISRLEKTGDNKYKSILEIKLGPVNSSFTGDLQMEDITVQNGFKLKVQQNSKIGNANAAIKISLIPENDNKTEVAFEGDVKLSGMLATMGQRLIGGVSITLTKQFFANLEKELKPPVSSPLSPEGGT
jgi:carbon monoxide dehydrogenase subunit G